AILLLDESEQDTCAVDPAIAAAWRFARRFGPLRSGERLMHHRFWMSEDAYQDRTAVTLTAAVGGARWLTTPVLAWSFIPAADPDHRAAHFAEVGFPRAAEADFEVGGRRYGVFAHDWRVVPPLAWIDRKGLLEFTDSAAPSTVESRRPLLVLSRPDF